MEFKERHRLERDLKWQGGRRFVDLNVLGSEMPELVREDDGSVETFSASVVAFVRDNIDICDKPSKDSQSVK